MTTDLVGSFEHYTRWQPGEINSYMFELQEMPNAGDMKCFRCVAAEVAGDQDDDPTPLIVIQAWGVSPDEAQYHAYKRAAYFITHGVIPKPGVVELIEQEMDEIEEDGYNVVREYE